MDNPRKIILDLCAGTGSWSKPYQQHPDIYDVRLIELPDYDVRLYIPPANVYGILAAPPCTHLSSSGARWFKQKGEKALLEALSIVDACLRIIWRSNPVFWALENPVGRLSKYLGKPIMYFNPCDYGDAYTKKTCLWGKFNIAMEKHAVKPLISSNDIPKGSHSQDMVFSGLLKQGKNPIYYLPPSQERGKIRSITPSGFARAFYEANQ